MSDNLINLITFTDQSFLALMALVGATMVFKLQLIDKQIDLSLNAFRMFVKQKMLTSLIHSKWADKDVDCWLDKDVDVHLRSFVAMESKIQGPFFDALCDYYLILEDLKNLRGELINRTKRIICFLLLPILISKAFLFPFLIKYIECVGYFSVTYLILSIIPCYKFFKFTLSDLSVRRINNPETNNAIQGIDFSEGAIKNIAEKRYEAKIGQHISKIRE